MSSPIEGLLNIEGVGGVALTTQGTEHTVEQVVEGVAEEDGDETNRLHAPYLLQLSWPSLSLLSLLMVPESSLLLLLLSLLSAL